MTYYTERKEILDSELKQALVEAAEKFDNKRKFVTLFTYAGESDDFLEQDVHQSPLKNRTLAKMHVYLKAFMLSLDIELDCFRRNRIFDLKDVLNLHYQEVLLVDAVTELDAEIQANQLTFFLYEAHEEVLKAYYKELFGTDFDFFDRSDYYEPNLKNFRLDLL